MTEMSKYQWPASKLTEKEMELLFLARESTGRSICELLKDAVHTAYDGVKNGTITTGISRNTTQAL